MADPPAVRTLRDLLNLKRVPKLSPIVIPRPTAGNTFEFCSDYHRMLPEFCGSEFKDPYHHIRDFDNLLHAIVSVPSQLVQAQLRLFPFTLKGKAKTWFNSLRPQSLTSWGDVQGAFLTKFFPPSQTKLLMDQIQNFRQREKETFPQYWERFKDLLSSIPHHNFAMHQRINYFVLCCSQASCQLLVRCAWVTLWIKHQMTLGTIWKIS